MLLAWLRHRVLPVLLKVLLVCSVVVGIFLAMWIFGVAADWFSSFMTRHQTLSLLFTAFLLISLSIAFVVAICYAAIDIYRDYQNFKKTFVRATD